MRGRQFLITLCSLAVPALLCAQQGVRGSVTPRDSGTRVSGLIIQATDATGKPVARTLTGAKGEYNLSFPDTGRFGLQILGIGSRPTATAPFPIEAGEIKRVDIGYRAEPVTLAKVTVRGKSICGVTGDSAKLVLEAWEEARKALVASQLTPGDVPYVAEWTTFTRSLEPRTSTVRRQSQETTRKPTTHAFRSPPADSLTRAGYVVNGETSAQFYAPDPDVLLSRAFMDEHCFHLEPPPPDRGGVIGLAFEPAAGRRGMNDIEGTLWLDDDSAELRWLDYRYTRMPPDAAYARPGGRVEFLRLAGGSWLVNRWSIRMPAFEAQNAPGRALTGLVSSRVPTVSVVHISGGEVSDVLLGDSVLYHASTLSFAARILSRETSKPVRGAIVALVGTEYEGATDSTGTVRIPDVLAGRYRLTAQTNAMIAARVPPIVREIEVRADLTGIDTLAVPTSSDALRPACPSEVARKHQSELRGALRDSVGRPVAGAAVRISWGTELHRVDSDEQGKWRICGAPREQPIRLEVRGTHAFAFAQTTVPDNQVVFTAADLVMYSSVPASP